MKNSLPQYDHHKRCEYDGWGAGDVPACEQVPFDLLVAWQGLNTTGPILDGDQHPPMASFIAAPSMAEAVDFTVRVTRALAASRPA